MNWISIGLAALQDIAREYVFLGLTAWNQARNAESALLEIPAFQAIKQYDPKTYKNILSDIKGSLRKGSAVV